MASLLSYAIIVGVIIVALIPIVSFINENLQEGKTSQIYMENMQAMRLIDSQIREIMLEAPGSKRVLDIYLREGTLNIIGGEDMVKIIIENVNLFSPGKTKEGNIEILSGTFMKAYESDIDGNGTTDLVLENNVVMFAMPKKGTSSSLIFINTTDLISLMRIKTLGINATPSTALYINDNASSYFGYGYTEITRKGENLPSSGIRLWLNSTSGMIYEAVFTLDALSDYVSLEVQHIA
jgi:hypothetical protein